MLLHMATGNLAYRIPEDSGDSRYNELATMLNEIASKMQENELMHPNFMRESLYPAEQPGSLIVQKLQDYIMNNLHEPLPTTRELSKMFGTNEFTLKENFRVLLHTSIYQFYNDERLKKAYYLILQTDLPLKEIAFICGFNDYTNFFKAFKKKYGETPKEVQSKPRGKN